MRRKLKKKRIVEGDLKFQSPLVATLINKIMYSGKKSLSEKIVYGALADAEKKLGKTAMEIMTQVIDNAGPQLELKSRRVGGANYQVPYEVRGERRTTLALRWIIEASRKVKGKAMRTRLADEIINAFNNTGTAVKKKQDMHKMADANKAFAHFAW